MNPFINDNLILHLDSNTRKFPTYQTHEDIIEETGEIKSRTISTTKEYLKMDFVSIFIHTIKLELEFDLSSSAHKLWNILMLTYVDKNNDTVYYNYEDRICNQTLSKATYYKAVKELIKYKFIAKHKKLPFTYYVNPKYFYNGDRLKIINEIRKI